MPLVLLALLTGVGSKAQLTNNGGSITISNGAQIICGGNLNNTGTITNSGSLKLGGNLTNTGTLSNATGSTFHLQGSSLQTINGNSLNVYNAVLNNAAGITLNTDLLLQGVITFTSGNINTGAGPNVVAFANGSGIGNTPTDASHINGRVQFHGIGSFILPIGNSTKYQPIQLNLSSNTGGLIAAYNAADAGAAIFTTAGSSSTPLVSYNKNEYWQIDLADQASGSVDGSITLYWDGYKDGFSNPLSQRKLAYKVNNTWQNEGGNATGTEASGSLTSNNINSWGAFTLGSVTTPLPLRWLSLNGKLNNAGQAMIQWKVAEQDVLQYSIEKSTNAREFTTIGNVSSKGSGANDYQFTEPTLLGGTGYYRIKQVGKNGETAYSSVIKLFTAETLTVKIAVNPSLVRSNATLNISVPTERNAVYSVVNADGKIVLTQSVLLSKGVNAIPLNVQQLAKGTYRMIITDETRRWSVGFVKM